MENKVVLITGSSTGLGLKTSVLLAQKGYKVYATMRNLEKSSELEKETKEQNVSIAIKQLDVSDPGSIQKCIAEIFERERKIDILINNAGAGFLRASEHTSEEELLHVTDVNYLGVVRCTNAVLSIMRKQKSGHIINISSVGGLVGQPFNELYCAAKFAVEGYTEALATYLTPFFRIKFTIVEPGGISTEFANNVYKTVSPDAFQEDIYGPILQQYADSVRKRPKEELERIYQSGEQVAQIIMDCIENENPPLRARTSKWSNEFCELKTNADPDGLKLHDRLTKLYWGK